MKVIHKFAFHSVNFVDSNYEYNKRMNIFEYILNEGKSIIQLESCNNECNNKENKMYYKT